MLILLPLRPPTITPFLLVKMNARPPKKKYPVLSSAAETKQPMGFPTCILCGKPLWYRIQSHQSPFGCRHVMCHTCARVECPVCTWSVSVKRELSAPPPPTICYQRKGRRGNAVIFDNCSLFRGWNHPFQTQWTSITYSADLDKTIYGVRKELGSGTPQRKPIITGMKCAGPGYQCNQCYRTTQWATYMGLV